MTTETVFNRLNMNLQNYLKYLEHFSLITVDERKIPTSKWKEQQSVKLTPEEFTKHYNDQRTTNVGIVTGFEDLEVVDVDLKVFSTTEEKNNFWNELLSLLRNAIFDFDEKFVIYKTRNAGYHVLYKSKRVGKNVKLAVLKGHKEACIETRATGGYVFMYPDNKISKNSYFDVQYISDADREELMRICKSYHYIEPVKQIIEPKLKKQYNTDKKTPWDDFNEQNTVWSVISDGFDVIRDTPTKTFIKRHGGTSVHSGIIYKNENLLWLFSTGTIYPHEKQINPYTAYTWKYHNGDFSASAKDLYEQGFGDRFKVEPPKKEKNLPIVPIEDLDQADHIVFPLDVFPESYKNFILECNQKLDLVKDYMACSLLWVASICIGNGFKIEVKRGWSESPNIWIALVGSAGIGKTPSVSMILKPLENENSKKIKEYMKKSKEFKEYDKLTKKEKQKQVEVKKPRKDQFIVNDITLEALVQSHEQVVTGVGVFKDELAGWFKDMNKYREGSDLEFWLSSWSGKSVSVVRVTREDSFVENPFIPVIGGIQPNILDSIFNEEKKDNGFIDRMLLSYPDIKVAERYNEQEIGGDGLEWYYNTIISLKRQLEQMTAFNDNNDVDIQMVKFSKEAKKIWIQKFESISQLQNSDNESEYFKSMYPKQKSYIPRFAFLLHVLHCSVNNITDIYEISEKAMLGACELSDYFVAMAKKIQKTKRELSKVKEVVKSGSDDFEKIKMAYKLDPSFNRKEMAIMLGVSRQMVYNHIKKIQENA